MLKIPFEFFWNIQNVVFSSKQSFWSKNNMFCGLFNFDENRCIRALPAWPFCWLIFLVEFFKCWKCPSNSSETFKMLFFHQNNQFEAKTGCFADFSILTKIAVSGPFRRGHFVSWFFWLIFWNVENTLPILLKQLKCCSFIKPISMFCGLFSFDENCCIRNLPAWPFFCLIFWNVENTLPILLKHSKCCSFTKTISMFCGVFNFDQNRCTGPDPFSWLIFLVEFFEMLKIPFQFYWNIQNVVLSSKQPVWSKSSMFCGLFNFDQNRCIMVDFFGWVFRTLPAWPFC